MKVIFLSGAGALFASVVATSPVWATSVSKADLYSQMNSLANQIKSAKAVAGSQGSSALDSLLAQYQTISGSLGGDDPAGFAAGSGSGGQAAPSVRSTPSAPPGGTSTTYPLFSNNTPAGIPSGPAVVTSTIAVSGADPYLWDLDVTTFITHSFAADLDITITSPAGTVVTLTTDNGGSNDNVFNGTVWDDSANPGGQVPYTTNNGLVTDQSFLNLVATTPLVPEEALAAFIGEDPNGTWTLTISDDLAGDGGSLDSWSLTLTALSQAPIMTPGSYASTDTPLAIPTGPAVVTSSLAVSSAGTFVCDVNLTTHITHTFAADLDMTLTSPAGTVVTLTTDNGGSNDDVFNGTVWDDDANPGGQVPYTTNNGLVTEQAYANLTLASQLVPEEALGAFIGEDPNGVWTLTISDDLAGDGGSINDWSIDVTTCEAFNADLSITKDDGVASVAVGGATTYTLVASNAGPSDVASASVVDNFPADLSCTWSCSPAGGASCTAGPVSGNISDSANLPAGSSATYTANCAISLNAAPGSLSNTATISSAITDPNPANNSATDLDTLVGGAGVTATKTVSGSNTVGSTLTYTIVMSNAGPGPQLDNPGDELTDVVPPGLIVSSVAATSGTVVANGNSVTWNGVIPANSSVTVTIDALVDASAGGTTLSNQGTVTFDSDGNGTNDSVSMTDDPGVGGSDDPTDITIAPNIGNMSVPTLSDWALMVLSLLMLAVALRRSRSGMNA